MTKRAGKPKQKAAQASNAAVDVRMLELLACPLTKGPLTWDASANELVSPVAKIAFPLGFGILVMLLSEARVIETI